MTATLEPNAFEEVVRVRCRPRFTVEPASIAWDAVAFTVRGARDAVACVPRDSLESFLDDLDAGRLDESIESFLATPPAGRVLRASTQAAKPGLFDAMGAPGAMLPDERVPGRGPLGLGGGGGGRPVEARQNKRRRVPRPRKVLIAGVVAGVAVVAAGAIAIAAGGGGGEKKVSAAGAPTSTTTSTSTTTTTLPLNFTGSFNVTFTVTAVNVAPHFAGEVPPAIGDVTQSTASVSCTPLCTITGDKKGFGFGFVDTLVQTGDHLEGTFDNVIDLKDCNLTNHQVFKTFIDIQRDPTGAKVIGFTGQNVVVHPEGVEEVVGRTTCSTFDVTTSFVAVPA